MTWPISATRADIKNAQDVRYWPTSAACAALGAHSADQRCGTCTPPSTTAGIRQREHTPPPDGRRPYGDRRP